MLIEKVPTVICAGFNGRGLFALERTSRGRVLVEYRGERIEKATAEFGATAYVSDGIGDEYLLTVT